MQKQELKASLRQGRGKGASRELRRQGMIPAVIYGDKKDSISISICPRTLMKEINKGKFSSRLFGVKTEKAEETCLCKKVEFDVISGQPLHADFLRVNEKKPVKLNINLEFINKEKSPGIKQGGVLNILRRKIQLFCLPKNIPENIVIDLDGLDFGDSIHVGKLELPEGVSLADTSINYSILTIVAPRVLEEVETTAEEGEDGEEGSEDKEAEGSEEKTDEKSE